MKKVLFVVHELQAAGIETFLINVVKNIDRRKFHIDFALNVKESQHQFYEDTAKQLGCSVFKLGDTKSKNRLVSKMQKRKNLKVFLKSNHYDIVHINNGTNMCYLEARIAKKCGIKKIVIHAHNSEMTKEIAFYPIQKFLHRYFKHKWKKTGDVFLACSTLASDWMFPPELKEKVIIVNNGIDIHKFEFSTKKRSFYRSKYGIDDNCFLIGTIGRIEYQKNHEFIIRILEKLLSTDSRYKVMIVGDGSLKPFLVKNAKVLGVDNNVIFAGVQEDIAGYLSAFDVFLMPSRFEGLGIAAIEAQANGVKSLISDQLPKAVMVRESCKALSLLDIDSWVKEIEKLSIHRERDKELNEALMGYDIRSVAKILESIYER